MMPAYATATRPQTAAAEGVAVIGEAVRRIAPESAEFLIEIAASGASASQALKEHQARTSQIVQAVSSLGVHRTDLQTVSMNVNTMYGPPVPSLPPYTMPQLGPVPSLGPVGFGAYGAPPQVQPDIQFGAYQAKSAVRVTAREAGRAGEIADALVKAGAAIAGGLCYRASDDAAARKGALEAAGKDARSKAETLATAAGKQLGDPISISEEIVASNGVYSALRAQMPWAFGPDTPTSAGELEYYARVTASFRFQ